MKKLLNFVCVCASITLAVFGASAQAGTTVTLLHFSDYHAHAVPYYLDGQPDSAGIARAMAYLQPYADDPEALIFSGGDMLNQGAPAWSDRYQCIEWSWFNGIVRAMAFGNHDADYGPEVFARCAERIDYPILGSNVLDGNGDPLFAYAGKTYQVYTVNGLRIGVFAVAGPDYERLLRPETMPAKGTGFADRIETSRAVVKALREDEKVDAVVLIGHALYEDDLALARAVPGIDLIFGTHSHRKQELTAIPGTKTYIISPFQYLAYISRVELEFIGEALSSVSGRLVKMSNDLTPAAAIADRVADLQTELEADPEYSYLYSVIGQAGNELATAGQFAGEATLGNLVTDIIREAAGAHLAILTASGFRQPIPPGPILEENLLTAMPYKNRVLTYAMNGAQVQQLLDYSVSRSGSDFFSQVSGVRFEIDGNQAVDVRILNDPQFPGDGYASLDPARSYLVATSDFQGLYAGGYKEIFAAVPYSETGLDVREQVRRHFRNNNPVTGRLDGRIVIP